MRINLISGRVDLHVQYSSSTMVQGRLQYAVYTCTVYLAKTELGTLRSLLLGGIIENQNSDFVMSVSN